MFRKTAFSFFMLCIMSLSLAGCASPTIDKVENDATLVDDPFEDVNRAMFAVNEVFDQSLFEPVARGYRAVTPEIARKGVRNFLRNLHSPINIGNQLLQGDLEGTLRDVYRLGVNTTFGIGGLVDVAAMTGHEYEYEDFGQTLAVWGVGHGPYMVLPLYGPSTLRDTTGLVVDSLADPVRIYLDNKDEEGWHYARIAAIAISEREELLDVIDDLRENSIDFYATIRSAYIQRRYALINDEDPDSTMAPSIPDYDYEDFDDEFGDYE